jgi:hypothetical protein
MLETAGQSGRGLGLWSALLDRIGQGLRPLAADQQLPPSCELESHRLVAPLAEDATVVGALFHPPANVLPGLRFSCFELRISVA